MSKQKKNAKILKRLLAVALGLLALELAWLLFAMFGPGEPAPEKDPVNGETTRQEQEETLPPETTGTEALGSMPWEKPGAKQPEDYSWEEFETLTGAQQMEFQDYLGFEGFMEWMDRAQTPSLPQEMPWEKSGAKQPGDYTWAEFEALTAEQQTAFQDYLGFAGFAEWMDRAQTPSLPQEMPWEKSGAKQPGDYTWAEFEALTAEQQTAFQDYLGFAGFAEWLDRTQSLDQPMKMPWDVPGAKQPEEYTWEEFEALTDIQQMVFQDYLGEAGFEAWMSRAQG